MRKILFFSFFFFLLGTVQTFACKEIRGSLGRFCAQEADQILSSGTGPDEEVLLVAWGHAPHGQTDTVMAYIKLQRDNKGKITGPGTEMTSRVLLDKNCKIVLTTPFLKIAEATKYILDRNMLECSCDYPYGLGMDGRKCGSAYKK